MTVEALRPFSDAQNYANLLCLFCEVTGLPLMAFEGLGFEDINELLKYGIRNGRIKKADAPLASRYAEGVLTEVRSAIAADESED